MTDTNVYTENSIRTYTGKVFDLAILDPESICIEDIAHALSLTARFGGHLEKLYSVAQHSFLTAAHVGSEIKLAALLHDASEAYLGDMPSPFKKMMPDFKAHEDRVMKAIANKFGFDYPLHPDIKKVDRELLDLEFDSFHLKIEDRLQYWTPEESETHFLRMYYDITGQK